MILGVVFITLVFLYSLISEKMEKTVVTAPMVFTGAGIVLFLCQPELREWQANVKVWLAIAETGLVMLLFTEASRTPLAILKHIRALPMRLLSTGMLLTILLGAVAAKVVFPAFTIWEAGILAAILAPTDAGLGQIIVNSPLLPVKIRQALNVEAGLNDGLAVPFMLFFIALASAAPGEAEARLWTFIVEQLGYGTLVGGVIGLAGGGLLGLAHRHGWMARSWLQVGVVALPLLCMIASEHAGASMFIAAFVAGLTVQAGYKEAGVQSVEFAEGWGHLLNLFVFFFFGIMVMRAWPGFTAAHLVYALLSLTLIRMIPVAIALIGTRLSRPTVLFMGWFGPRGLASIVLGMVYLEEKAILPGEPAIRLAAMLTVLVSIFAHGVSALPGMSLYARLLGALPPGAPERDEPAVSEKGSSGAPQPSHQ